MNCLGMLSREAGHRRVPAPPHMMMGWIKGFASGIRVGSTMRHHPWPAPTSGGRRHGGAALPLSASLFCDRPPPERAESGAGRRVNRDRGECGRRCGGSADSREDGLTRVSTVSPLRRAQLRHLKADFDTAFAAVTDPDDRDSAAYRAADARYRTWVREFDAVALALLDELDAFEAAGEHRWSGSPSGGQPPAAWPGPCHLDDLFAEIADLQRAADLIGTPERRIAREEPSARTRAMSVVGQDRVARHCTS